ncbi:MAG: response regulator transcription factor [Thiotrichales bacterium]|nr:response regulator transcription factor [Thiotrichales bacterium]
MIFICSQSNSFNRHIREVFGDEPVIHSRLLEPNIENGKLHIIHAPSYASELADWVDAFVEETPVAVAIAADIPDVEAMLNYAHHGVKGYCNSHMAEPYYKQLQKLLESDQTWYPPSLLAKAFNIARQTLNRSSAYNALSQLTAREKEISFAVADGDSNKIIAQKLGIVERTVKSHLTSIFDKLRVKDRVVLVIYLNQFNFRREDKPNIV